MPSVLTRTSYEAYHILTKEERKKLSAEAVAAAEKLKPLPSTRVIFVGPHRLVFVVFCNQRTVHIMTPHEADCSSVLTQQ